MRKGLVLILDGLGDRPQRALGGETPLEAARTPNLDRLASEGLCGLVDPIHPGVAVDTHVGTGALMGLAPEALAQLARGPVEAAGIGLAMRAGDVALRCNFATLERDERGWRIVDRRAGRIREGTGELCAALDGIELDGGVETILRPATGHRAVLRLSGLHLSEAIEDTDPGSGVEPAWLLECRPLYEGDAAAAHTAAALEGFLAAARERLRDHPVNRRRVERGLPPANGLLSRGAGKLAELSSLVGSRELRAAVVSGERTVLGMGALLGMTTLTDPRFTASPQTDLGAKVAAALSAFERHDLVYVHVKAPDVCSHDRDPLGKRDALEALDAHLGPLLGRDLVIGVTGDHSSDSAQGRHVGDPLPSLLCSPAGRRDACRSFGESACMSGGLGRLPAAAFLTCLLDAMDVVLPWPPHDRGFPGRAD